MCEELTELLCFGKHFEVSFLYHRKKKRGEKGPRHEKYAILLENDARKQCLKLLFSNLGSIIIFVLLRLVVNLRKQITTKEVKLRKILFRYISNTHLLSFL